MDFKNTTFLLFCSCCFSTILLYFTLCRPGFGGQVIAHSNLLPDITDKEGSWRWKDTSARRLMIGSAAPTCTYNECRRCRSKCRAEQVPVDDGDPMNSAYRYKCVCRS